MSGYVCSAAEAWSNLANNPYGEWPRSDLLLTYYFLLSLTLTPSRGIIVPEKYCVS